ncbi:MAG: LacI family DNA-binding transcriptional regulator [Pseudomonadota bacterium]
MAKVTIDDVAHLAGVSIKTVSRVVNQEPNVRESTRVKVETAITRLNYRPNLSARNLASHRSHLIALVYDDPGIYDTPSAGYVIRLQQGALRACQNADCELLIHPCNYREPEVRSELMRVLERSRPDGVVIAAPLSNMKQIFGAAADAKVPYVRLSPGVRSSGEFCVGTDDRAISARMTEHLASLGHKRIGFISGHTKHRAVANRLRGYQDGLAKAGLKFQERWVAQGDNSIRSGEAAGAKLMERKVPPTAIFAANDDMAAGVVRYASRAGIAIPGQLSVAGFDDSALAQHIYPALTTVRQPLAAMADRAVTSLLARAREGEPQPGLEVIPGELKLRESTGSAPS